MRAAVRTIVFGARGPGWSVEELGVVKTLPLLGAALAVNPAANVYQLGNYNAVHDGIFSATPLAATSAVTYTGVFDGQGYVVRNFRMLDISPEPGLEDGLFGNVGDNSGNGTVKRLTVSGSILQTQWERSTMDVAGRFLLGTTMGGVVGMLRGNLDDITSNMTIVGSGAGGQYGGMVGRSNVWSAKTITGITQANPAEITLSAPHGMPNGARIGIVGVVGMTEINRYVGTVTVTAADKFTVAVDSTGYSAYVSGGSVIGSGTVRNSRTNAIVSIDRRNYNPYLSTLVGSNYGLIEYCVIAGGGTAPSGYVDSPPTTQYSLGWTGTASIAGDVMSVTDTGLGTMRVGLYLYVPNEDSGTTIPSGIHVIADLGGGDWQLSASTTLASRDLKAAEGAPGTFPSVGTWLGGGGGDCGLPTVDASPTALIQYCIFYATLNNGANTNGGNTTGGGAGFVGDGTLQYNVVRGNIAGANRAGGVAGLTGLATSTLRRNVVLGSVSSQKDVDGNYGNNIGGIGGDVAGICEDNESYANILGGSAIGGDYGIVRATAVVTGFVAFGTVNQGRNTDGTYGIGAGGSIGQTIAGATLDQGVSTGPVTGLLKLGGAIGVFAPGTIATNVRWNTDASGYAQGIGQGSSAGVTAITDAALTSSIPAGFDGRWSRDVSQSSFYPYINTLPLSLLPGGLLPAPTIDLNPPKAVSFVGSAVSFDSVGIVMPADIQPGDYAWMFGFSQNTSTTIPALVMPAGWTFVLQAIDGTTHGVRFAMHVKVCDGTESGTTVNGMLVGTRGKLMGVMVVRPNRGSTWTRLNPRVVVSGAAAGSPVQSMGSGTSPCFVVGAGIYDSGTPPADQISLGDDITIDVTSAMTPALMARMSFHLMNTGAASSTFTGDSDAGGAGIACVNVSLS